MSVADGDTMNQPNRPITLKALQDAGWQSRTVKEELRQNFTKSLAEGVELFPGIRAYTGSWRLKSPIRKPSSHSTAK